MRDIPIVFRLVGLRQLQDLALLMYFNTLRVLDLCCRIHKSNSDGYTHRVSILVFYRVGILLCFFLFSSSVQSDHDDEQIQKIRLELNQINGTSDSRKALSILNASYEPTRKLFKSLNTLFCRFWKEKTGQNLQVYQSHGGSGIQARSVIGGLQADVVTLALSYDVDVIVEKTNLIATNWASAFPFKSVPYLSTIIFLVRKGNPKKIKDWGDLVRQDIKVIMPNPKTSGAARWNYLAAWAYAISEYGNERKAKSFLKALYKNVPIMDAGARGAATSFVQRAMGDVLVTWENDVKMIQKEFGREMFEIVVPSISVLAEMPVAVVTENAKLHGTTEVATAYLKFLYTEEAQHVLAQHDYRPVDSKIRAEYKDKFPEIKFIGIDDLGGWHHVHEKHFKSGALFDQLFKN